MIQLIENEIYPLFAFNNTACAMKAQKFLMAYTFLVLPTPTIVAESCGIALLCCKEDLEAVRMGLAKHLVEYSEFQVYWLQFLGKGRWQLAAQP